jgi:mannose-6-phosphate isomerase-like protein (cupin superfamily)
MSGLRLNIEKETLDNTNYRQVLFTTKENQLVLMNLQPGEDIPLETHKTLSQFIRVEAGQGKAIVNGVEHQLSDGIAIVIPSGLSHYITNTSVDTDLKLYTVYSGTKFEHPDGLIQERQPVETETFLTGNRDVDFLILGELSDDDLINICRVNKDAGKLCKNQRFWYNRIKIKFPYLTDDILNTYKKDRTWADYYIELVTFTKRITKLEINGSEVIRELVRVILLRRLDLVISIIKSQPDISTDTLEDLVLLIKNMDMDIQKYISNHIQNHIKRVYRDGVIPRIP